MPGYNKAQVVAMNADPSGLRHCPNCDTYWSTPQGFASHTRACQPLVVISNVELPNEVFWFEPPLLEGVAHKLMAALVEPKAGDVDAETDRKK